MDMKKLTNKIISIILSLVMMLSMTAAEPVFAQGNQSITINGYTFKIVNKDLDGVKLTYSDEDNDYIFYLERQNASGKADVVVHKTNLLERSNITSDYIINFDEAVEYSSDTDDFSSAVLVDEATGDEYSLNPNSRIAFVIPIGIPLLTAAIEALLAAGAVILIAGVAYTVVEEVAEALKRQKQYRYYEAILRNKAVYVGGGLSTSVARPLAYTDDSTGKILATSLSYARGLVSNSYRGPERNGASSGYWWHIHAKTASKEYKTHIWYLD